MRKVTIGLMVLALVAAFSAPAMADFPEKPITYSIPFGPGGQSDLEARRQQPLLEKYLGVDVIVQYKPGGGGSVGWAELVKKKPNGYFISGINIPHIILSPWRAATPVTRPNSSNPSPCSRQRPSVWRF